MKALSMMAVLGVILSQSAQAYEVDEVAETGWQRKARFFGGVRGGVAVPDEGNGVAPMMGVEMGVSVPSGFGFGLHILTMTNSPNVPALKIRETAWALGAMADLRVYFQTVEPLSLYGTLAAGFVGGPAREDGRNEVLPMVNPGFGGRVKLGNTYAAFEFGMAGFQIPFVSMSFGFEPERKRKVQQYVPMEERTRETQETQTRHPPSLLPTGLAS